MDKNTIRQVFYVIGIIATVYIAIRYILPLLLKLTGFVLGIVITAVIFALIIAAIIYSIAKLTDMIQK